MMFFSFYSTIQQFRIQDFYNMDLRYSPAFHWADRRKASGPSLPQPECHCAHPCENTTKMALGVSTLSKYCTNGALAVSVMMTVLLVTYNQALSLNNGKLLVLLILSSKTVVWQTNVIIFVITKPLCWVEFIPSNSVISLVHVNCGWNSWCHHYYYWIVK